MKKITILMMAVVLAVDGLAASLAEASAKITDIINNPSLMRSVAQSLSPDDQVTFLKRINSAVANTTRTPDTKTALFYEINKAALLANKGGNLKTLLAEIFATVPPASLTVLNDRFAAELFNRRTRGSKSMDDATFKRNVLGAMKVIQSRTDGKDKDVRDTFAIVMFLKSSRGTPADLKDALVANLSDGEARELASESWIPSAMTNNYDPMLAAADVAVTETPSPAASVLNKQGAFVLTGSLMSDLSATVNGEGVATVVYSETFLDPNKYALPDEGTSGLNRVPRSLDPRSPVNPIYTRDEVKEAGGYPMQTTL